jgi:hypothetical protein
MRVVKRLLIAAAVTSMLWAQPADAQNYDRFRELIDNTAKSPGFWVYSIGGGILDDRGKFPREWDAQDHALLKRNMARIGQSFVASTMEAALAVPLHQHVGYERCQCSGVLRRTGHTIWRTFVQRHVDGHLVLNMPFLASKYGSAVVANAWYPESYGRADVISQATFGVASAVALNLLDEFSPLH